MLVFEENIYTYISSKKCIKMYTYFPQEKLQYVWHTIFLPPYKFFAFLCIKVFLISNLAFLTPNFYTFFLDLPPKMSLFILVNSSFSSPALLMRNSLTCNSSFLTRNNDAYIYIAIYCSC